MRYVIHAHADDTSQITDPDVRTYLQRGFREVELIVDDISARVRELGVNLDVQRVVVVDP